MNLDEAVRYPTRSDSWIKTVLIGGILIFLGFLLVPLFLVYGYIVRSIGAVLADDPSPPEFDEWGELFVDGALAWIISIVYLLVPLLVAGFTVGGSIAAVATGSEIGAAAGAGGLLVGLTISTILSLAFGYLAVVAIVNFAREGQFGAAFDLDVIKTVALDRDYAMASSARFRSLDGLSHRLSAFTQQSLPPISGLAGSPERSNRWTISPDTGTRNPPFDLYGPLRSTRPDSGEFSSVPGYSQTSRSRPMTTEVLNPERTPNTPPGDGPER